MKSVLFLALLMSANVFAAESLQTLAIELVSNPEAKLSAQLAAKDEPVKFSVVDGEKKLEAEGNVDELFQAVRDLTPDSVVKAGKYSYAGDWQSLSLLDGDQVVGKVIYDLNAEMKEYQYDKAIYIGEPLSGFVGYTRQVLSIVGPYVTLLVNGDASYPGDEQDYHFDNLVRTVDVRGRDVNLVDMVTEDALVRALKNDAFIKGSMYNNKTRKVLASSKKLWEVVAAFGAFGNRDGCRTVPGENKTINHFAVLNYDVESDVATVRIATEATSEDCQAKTPTVFHDLSVKPTGEFKALLIQHKQDNEGWFTDWRP